MVRFVKNSTWNFGKIRLIYLGYSQVRFAQQLLQQSSNIVNVCMKLLVTDIVHTVCVVWQASSGCANTTSLLYSCPVHDDSPRYMSEALTPVYRSRSWFKSTRMFHWVSLQSTDIALDSPDPWITKLMLDFI